MANIRDIARVCGVAPTTVSSVLNNKAGKVSLETQARVLQVVREMGYRPRARTFGRELLTLGLLPSTWAGSFILPGYYQYIHHEILALSCEIPFNLLSFASMLFDLDPHQSVRTYCDGRCEGLLVLSPPLDTSLLTVMEQRGTPFVVVGRSGNWIGVDVDNVLGARLATEHLLALGHHRIALIVSDMERVMSAAQRHEGYRQALAARGRNPDDAEVVVIPDTGFHEMESYHRVAARWLAQNPEDRPTGLFCWNDTMALMMMEALQSAGLRVPEDISVVGFDDIPATHVSKPTLTTIRQPYAEIVRHAVDALIAQIHGGPPLLTDILLPPELIVRASTAPPRL